ncbi:hypothetical protein KAI87_13870, partial [Myxococcota bacterium]|nr:hypothetical protein [Myxococcota bacterium]
MKFIHLFLLMSLFGLNACTVDVPDLYTGDFRCHDDYDCADDFYCDTYSDPTGDSFCRAHDTPDDPNTDSCDTSNCAFPYHCNGDHCQDDPDACSSWNQGGDCPGTQADCWSGICVDHNYSCSDSYGENPLECGDSTIECHLNGVCTNSDGQECIPNNGDSAHKDCQEFHGSDSFCMAQPVCDNGTNPDGCEDNADCAYPFVCEYNSCTQDMSACAYNGSFCPNSGNCINGACYEAGAEDCDTTTCTSGCTANG